MGGWLYQWVVGGEGLISQIQGARSPFLDRYFSAATFMGEADFFLLLLPLFYWCIDKAFGRQLAFLLLFSISVVDGAKNLLQLPRPPLALHLIEQGGYGLPSGHAAIAVAIWGFIARRWGSHARWLWPAAVWVIASIAFSRLYLGVHYPADTLVGLLVGILVLALWLRLEPALSRRAGRIPLSALPVKRAGCASRQAGRWPSGWGASAWVRCWSCSSGAAYRCCTPGACPATRRRWAWHSPCVTCAMR